MTIMYHDGNRRLQDQFDSRRIADRVEEKVTRTAFTPDDQAFIEIHRRVGGGRWFDLDRIAGTGGCDGVIHCGEVRGLCGIVVNAPYTGAGMVGYNGESTDEEQDIFHACKKIIKAARPDGDSPTARFTGCKGFQYLSSCKLFR